MGYVAHMGKQGTHPHLRRKTSMEEITWEYSTYVVGYGRKGNKFRRCRLDSTVAGHGRKVRCDEYDETASGNVFKN